MYQNLVRAAYPDAPESVHLCDFPVADEQLINEELEEDMALARDLMNEGRSLRNAAKARVRQPLAVMKVRIPAGKRRERMEKLIPLMLDELNIRSMEFADSLEELATYSMKPNLKTLGPKYGKLLKQIGEKLEHIEDATAAARSLEAGGTLKFQIGDTAMELKKDDVLTQKGSVEGWAIGESVALDIRLDEELISAGLAREVIHRIQSARKDMDLDYEARIAVSIGGSEKILAVVSRHEEYIKGETLCKDLRSDLPGGQGTVFSIDGHELRFAIEPMPK
jgi:isoleucyl-tRNA synthetase